MQCNVASWRSQKSELGAQIDLLIERKDQIINLCEIKYSINEFVIDKKTDINIRNKISVFKNEVGTRKAINLTMITDFHGNIQTVKSRIRCPLKNKFFIFKPSPQNNIHLR